MATVGANTAREFNTFHQPLSGWRSLLAFTGVIQGRLGDADPPILSGSCSHRAVQSSCSHRALQPSRLVVIAVQPSHSHRTAIAQPSCSHRTVQPSRHSTRPPSDDRLIPNRHYRTVPLSGRMQFRKFLLVHCKKTFQFGRSGERCRSVTLANAAFRSATLANAAFRSATQRWPMLRLRTGELWPEYAKKKRLFLLTSDQ